MNFSDDVLYLQQALALAQTRRGFCAPNPSVGAVIVKAGLVLATGYHWECGAPHAEINALEKIAHKAKDATIYVTLEPCCHFGRTPPCTQALIQAGISRVVYAYRDPNPKVLGQGELELRQAGIHCEYLPLIEIDHFYLSYRHWIMTKTPWITAKIALTLNGKVADTDGKPLMITGPALQQFTHQQRKKNDAILSTINTILADDPQLNVRVNSEIIAKPIYILDSECRLPLTAKIMQTASKITVFHAEHASLRAQQKLIASGVNCVAIPGINNFLLPENNKNYYLDLAVVCAEIGKDGIHDLWVEAGGACFSAFFTQKLLQRALIYIAPKWLRGKSAFAEQELNFFGDKILWQQVGNDVVGEWQWNS